MKLKIATLLITALLFHACSIIDPAEPIPAYLHIQPFSFSTTVDQGSSSSKITDGWVYVGGDFLGAYTLPATLPIIATGQQEVQVFPGIKDNGISALPDIYPLYERYTLTMDLSSTRIDTIRPVTQYIEGLRFMILENFESSLHVLSADLDGSSATSVETTSSDVFEGQKSGIIRLSTDNPSIVVGSQLFTEYPLGGTPVYLEMNYKTNIPMAVGLYGYDFVGINIFNVVDRGVNVSEEWNKIYFNFSEEVRQMQVSNVESYQIVLQAVIPFVDGVISMDTAEILIDNVKLVVLD